MENYVFKVLIDDEICNKGLGQGIYSKTFTPDNYKNKTLVDCLNEQLENKPQTEFISCSKNLCLELIKHGLDKQPLRPYLAVIKNHSTASFMCSKTEELTSFVSEYTNQEKWDQLYLEMYIKKALMEIKQCDVEKMVIDLSHDIHSDRTYSVFFNVNLIKNKEEKEEYQSKKEVLVLNYISNDDIIILNPLQYDILYFLKRRFDIKIDNTILRYLSIFNTENLVEISKLFDYKGERYLFENMYCQRKSIYVLKKEIGFDNTIVLKTFVLRKCIQLINEKFNVKLPLNVNSDGLNDILEKTVRTTEKTGNDKRLLKEKLLQDIFKY